jgi:RNA polymerase subunit RPABC4/transcription elongation factor Spt4
MWIYLSALILGLGAMAAIWLYRRHQKNAYFNSDDDRAFPSFSPNERPARYSTTAESKTRSKLEQSGISAEAHTDDRDSSGMYLADNSHGERECPQCKRTFPSSIVVCPFDNAPLKGPNTSKPERRASDMSERLDRKVCSGCERRYPEGAEFCYHDGLPLTRDTRDAAAEAPVFKACEACGWEGTTDEMMCPNDGEELLKIDPSDATTVSPTIPLMVCPKCREFAPPGVAHCPDDGELLTPLTNMRVTEFPAGGFGPRRKICKTCGTQFSGQAEYCCHDGSRLLPLN